MTSSSSRQMRVVMQQKLPLEVSLPQHSNNPMTLPLTRTEMDNISPAFYFSPNPYLGDIVTGSRQPKFVEKPYQNDISCGKNSYVYDAHTYHTKVPPEGIELLIDYYTRPGDVVLDAFCGSGMTGVAAVEKGRKALLCDISPAATFIAFNITTPVNALRYLDAVRKMLEITEDLEQKLYTTHCRTCGKVVPMLYMVWSYGMVCNFCQQEFVLWDVARDERARVKESKIKTEFDCPHCGKLLKKRLLKKTMRYPVQVGYQCCGKGRQEEKAIPDEYDLALLKMLEQTGVPDTLWYPTNPLPPGFNTAQPVAAGITSIDKMYTPRALWAMAHMWALASNWPDEEIRPKLLFTLTSLYQRVTVFSEFRFWGGSSNTANYNVPAIMNEQNVFKTFARKADTIARYFRTVCSGERQVRISTQSACHLPQIPDKSVDYVFTDPPFGSNINYSEMNFLWESWLGTYTDITEEAIINKVQGKGIEQYRRLLSQSFAEMRRVMKDEAWMTVIFHNSSEKVWKALQEAICSAGFSIKGSQLFDKEHGTFKQFVSDNAVGYDLVLHCCKSDHQHELQAEGIQTMQHDARVFIRQAINTFPARYIVHYLHVTREKEVNYRRLYSEWLAEMLPKGTIGLSFEKFRELVDDVLRTSSPLLNDSLFS